MFERMYRVIEPVPGTATQRRTLRMKVRHALGPSSERPPDAERLFRAVEAMGRLVELTTGYTLRLRAPDGLERDAVAALSMIRVMNRG